MILLILNVGEVDRILHNNLVSFFFYSLLGSACNRAVSSLRVSLSITSSSVCVKDGGADVGGAVYWSTDGLVVLI